MLTANGQTSDCFLDQLEGKEIKSVDASAYYSDREIYAIKITFEDDSELLIKAGSVGFDQYSTTPIVRAEVRVME